jgi:hypothetical protein
MELDQVSEAKKVVRAQMDFQAKRVCPGLRGGVVWKKRH